ncbi:SPOR domain-containing protein [Morganella morganii]|uniref:SPOR domain-containing protein n=1 Tax=Morganella morganii TaxID=582 RepID=UPI002368929C|nr:SPOR domain-containing protein [Morganella morganii]
MTQKKHTVLLCLLAGVLIIPAAGNGTSAADGAAAGLPPVTAVSEPEAAAVLYHLGVSRMNGEGVGQDIVQGRYWIHLAARHGYPLAQYNLGVMYFDGIGGTYSRQCAQWWLTGAAGQDDAEVREMARQALQHIEPEMAALPKVYRPVTEAECDRLPEWRREAQPAAAVPVLPEGDTDTEKMVIAEDTTVTAQPAAPEVHSEASPVSESAAETETGTIKETAAGTEGTEKQKTPAENPAETGSSDISADDAVSADETAGPETGKTEAETPASAAAGDTELGAEKGVTAETPDAPVSADGRGNNRGMMSSEVVVITPSPDAGDPRSGVKESVVSQEAGTGGKETEMPSDVQPEKPKTLKPREIRPATVPAPVLNLGGSPATAPGRHYTLQLSGGTTAEELYRTARRHKLTNYVVYETVRHGQRWYVLVAGEYATLTAANQALKALPAELRRNGPWVRSLRQVQSELKR